VGTGNRVAVRARRGIAEQLYELLLVAGAQLMPGCDATVIAHEGDGVSVKTSTGEHRVPTRVADSLYVASR